MRKDAVHSENASYFTTLSENGARHDEPDELFPRIKTGNAQADEILGGGFPANSINIIMGQPGTGKTIFAERLLFHNAHGDRPLLYITTLSEPMAKVVSYAQRLNFFDVDKIGNQILYDDLGPDLSRDGPSALIPFVLEAIKRVSPSVIVIDSFKAVHDLATSTQQMRKLISEFAAVLSASDVTAFLIGEYTQSDSESHPEFAVADAIVQLERHPLGVRDERFFRVLKLRGSSYREGQHAFRITDTGLRIFPRLVTPNFSEYKTTLKRISSGVPGLDEMLGGGLWEGSTTVLIGSTGTGKTTMGLQFALAGIEAGEETLYVNFQENPVQLSRLLSSQGLDLNVRSDRFHHLYVSPVELQIDSVIVTIFELIKSNRIKRVVIDAVGDLATAASDSQRLHDYMYSLVQHFAVNGVTSFLNFETGLGHFIPDKSEQRFSYMADNVLLLAPADDTRRTIKVIKTRNSAHDREARDLQISSSGVNVASPQLDKH
jgi:circadian clock protein KaiC